MRAYSPRQFFIFHAFVPGGVAEKLLKQAINFADKRVGVSQEEKEIVFQARKSLLFNKGQSWLKKESETFDVTMGGVRWCWGMRISRIFHFVPTRIKIRK